MNLSNNICSGLCSKKHGKYAAIHNVGESQTMEGSRSVKAVCIHTQTDPSRSSRCRGRRDGKDCCLGANEDGFKYSLCKLWKTQRQSRDMESLFKRRALLQALLRGDAQRGWGFLSLCAANYTVSNRLHTLATLARYSGKGACASEWHIQYIPFGEPYDAVTRWTAEK